MTDITYEQGRAHRRAYLTSPHYAGMVDGITPDVAMRTFLPPIDNDMMQISRPLPKDRQGWVRGWLDEMRSEA